MKDKTLKIGDYVLATKWSDGDPRDHFCVGFLKAFLNYPSGVRYLIVDNEGIPFRANGFRRAEKISPKRGNWIVYNFKFIESSWHKVWFWKRAKMENIYAKI